MNITAKETTEIEVQFHGNFCSRKFESHGQLVINSYKCSNKKLSTADLWNARKLGKNPVIRNFQTGILK